MLTRTLLSRRSPHAHCRFVLFEGPIQTRDVSKLSPTGGDDLLRLVPFFLEDLLGEHHRADRPLGGLSRGQSGDQGRGQRFVAHGEAPPHAVGVPQVLEVGEALGVDEEAARTLVLVALVVERVLLLQQLVEQDARLVKRGPEVFSSLGDVIVSYARAVCMKSVEPL